MYSLLWLICSPACSSPAQQPGKPDGKPPAAAVAPAHKTPREIDDAIREEDAETKKLAAAYRKDQSPDKEERFRALGAAFRARCAKRTLALAEKYRKEPDLILLFQRLLLNHLHLEKPDAESAATLARALDILRTDFAESARLDSICEYLEDTNDPGAERLLRAALARNPSRPVQGIARLSLATMLHGRYDDHRVPDADRRRYGREAERLLEEIRADYGDVRRWSSRDVRLGPVAEDRLFVLRHLSLGMSAPDIVAADLTGRALKLSDYRGKVVVLDFWHIH